MRNILKRQTKNTFAIIDSIFPQKEPFAFRNSEINEYFTRIKGAQSYTMYPMLPDSGAWFDHGYGVAKDVYKENKRGYLKYYPNNAKKIHYLNKRKNYAFSLAYSFFLGETYVLLPFYEKHNIPFVFVLYPGGCFGLNNAGSDRMLKRIFTSKCFKGVIVTQKITKDYLEEKRLCPKSKIRYIYGGFVQFKPEQVKPKKRYKQDKTTFDICFVAAKYSEKGVDKGYDTFIATAKLLARQSDAYRFHVVGGFDEHEIDVNEIKDNITFYGYKKPDFLVNFYASMDVFIGPGRHSVLFPGNFDGFPLGIDAGYCGVALFVGDELKMNVYYKDGTDIVIIPSNPHTIAKKVEHYRIHPKELYELAESCQTTTQRLFDIDWQIDQRIAVFKEFADIVVDD